MFFENFFFPPTFFFCDKKSFVLFLWGLWRILFYRFQEEAAAFSFDLLKETKQGRFFVDTPNRGVNLDEAYRGQDETRPQKVLTKYPRQGQKLKSLD